MNKIRSGQLFWGMLFLTLGVLFLLVKIDYIESEWYFVWDLWPLLLIFWGLSLLVKGTEFRPFITALTGVLIGVIIYGSIYNIWYGFDFYDDDYDENNYETQYFSEDYDSSIVSAELELNAGVGTFVIKETSGNLVDGNLDGGIIGFNLDKRTKDGRAFLNFDMDDDEDIRLFRGRLKNRLEIKLNENPVWDLDIKLGAARSYFDLSKFKVSRINLETGATKTKIKIGEKQESVRVDVQMGAASLNVLIPESFGCTLKGDMVLILKDIPGFIKKDSGYYLSENFERATKKILIDVRGGVSSLEIERY